MASAPQQWTPPPMQYAPQQYAPQYAQPQQVIIQQQRKGVNHILHLLLTVFTAGIWLPVWILVVLADSC